MCKAMEKRIERERTEERLAVLLESIKKLMKNAKRTATQAMAALDVSEEDKEELEKRLRGRL